MKKYILLIAACYFGLFRSTLLGESASYPTFEDREGFKAAAENYILSDSPLKNEYNRSNEELIKGDERDWEDVLAKIMSDPGTYGIAKSAKAFSAAQLRGKARDSRITKASRPLLAAYIKDAEEKYEKFAKIGEPKSFMIYVELSGSIPSFLEIRDPQNLLTILQFLNSPSEEKIGLLEREVPNQVAAALREYGDPMHVQESRALAENLRDRGKSELANDIQRSVERIEKDAARKGSDSEERSLPKADTSGQNTPDHSEGTGSKPPWIILAVAASISLVGILILVRKG